MSFILGVPDRLDQGTDQSNAIAIIVRVASVFPSSSLHNHESGYERCVGIHLHLPFKSSQSLLVVDLAINGAIFSMLEIIANFPSSCCISVGFKSGNEQCHFPLPWRSFVCPLNCPNLHWLQIWKHQQLSSAVHWKSYQPSLQLSLSIQNWKHEGCHILCVMGYLGLYVTIIISVVCIQTWTLSGDSQLKTSSTFEWAYIGLKLWHHFMSEKADSIGNNYLARARDNKTAMHNWALRWNWWLHVHFEHSQQLYFRNTMNQSIWHCERYNMKR